MIRNIFIIVISIFILSCDRSGIVVIEGNIDNAKGSTLYLEKIDVGTSRLIDSVKIKANNNFSFKIRDVKYPSFYNLKLSNSNFITLLVVPRERVSVRASSSDLLITSVIQGSPSSASLQKLNHQLRNSITQILSLIKKSEQVTLEEEKNKIGEKIDSIMKSQRRFSIGFILDHMESLASITALYQKYDDESWVLNEMRDLQYLKIVSESLVKLWPESPHVKSLVKDAESKISDYNFALIMAAAGAKNIGESNYPDIALPTPEGDTLAISSLKARFILIIFSASWDRASVQHNLTFKPVYDNFRNRGFDIYQVSLERNTQEWFRSITFNEFNWNHVSELSLLNSRAASLYNVTNLPANFFIDQQTGILAKDISPGELNRRLADLLN